MDKAKPGADNFPSRRKEAHASFETPRAVDVDGLVFKARHGLSSRRSGGGPIDRIGVKCLFGGGAWVDGVWFDQD